MKRCSRCAVEQATSAFYAAGPGWTRTVCKGCTRAQRAARRAAGLTQAVDRARYHRSERCRAAVAANTKRWKARNPEKVEAQNIVAAAIKHGALTRQPCEVDGCATTAQAHHADYSEALEVRWLCPWHHARQHVAEGRLDHLRVAS